MKKIEATIKPFNLDNVKNALDEIGIEEMSVSEIKAFGRQKAHTEVFRGTGFSVGFLPEIKIELVLPDNRTDAAVAAILKAAGGSKIFVSNIDDAIGNRRAVLHEQAA